MPQEMPLQFDNVTAVMEATLQKMLQPVVELELLKHKECLSGVEVEKLYNIPEATLRYKRCRGGGPVYHQGAESGRVFYTHTDIRNWLNSIKRRV